MQIVILTYYARNPLLICPMEIVFSLYYYYKRTICIDIENLTRAACLSKLYISRSIFRSAGQINFRACLIATLGLRGMAQMFV
jgi:hypothetical protein